jgi:hypothetical protein
MKNNIGVSKIKYARLFEMIGYTLIVLIIAINVYVAANFYFLRSIKIPSFFFKQADKNELFDPKKRY